MEWKMDLELLQVQNKTIHSPYTNYFQYKTKQFSPPTQIISNTRQNNSVPLHKLFSVQNKTIQSPQTNYFQYKTKQFSPPTQIISGTKHKNSVPLNKLFPVQNKTIPFPLSPPLPLHIFKSSKSCSSNCLFILLSKPEWIVLSDS
jgi:hypothetical protein